MQSSERRQLDRLYRRFVLASKQMAGYPLSLAFDYSALARFLRFHINNLGDPFARSWHYRINTLDIERKVISSFAKLLHAPKNTYWGYVTNGGTEGNMHGLYIARELYPNGVVFYSDQTHYSVPKILKLLKMPSIKIKSDEKGEIDYLALGNSFDDRVPIILANIGTTMKGAVDDVIRIKEILSDRNIQQFYIHCDAAFFGMILPYLPELGTQAFDFRSGIDSIAISGHKMIGMPMPCGAVLCKKENLKHSNPHVEYTGTIDNTITGSRNGLTPLFLWHALHCVQKRPFAELIRYSIELAGYAIQKFHEHHIPAWRNKNSVIIVIPKPSEKLILKWQLACEGKIAHIITLPHLTHKIIDAIVHQIASDLHKKKSTRKR